MRIINVVIIIILAPSTLVSRTGKRKEKHKINRFMSMYIIVYYGAKNMFFRERLLFTTDYFSNGKWDVIPGFQRSHCDRK